MNKTISLSLRTPDVFFEFFIAFSLAAIYFYGITLLARTTVLFEIFFCLIVPIIIYQLKKHSMSGAHYRVMQLIMIETMYMVFVIVSKLSIQFNALTINGLAGYGFFSLFIIQFIFFMLYQYKVKSYFGMLRTAMFLVLVFPWFFNESLYSTLDSQGRFFMWGHEAPTLIVMYYCVWVIGVPLVDSRTLPNFRNALFHFSSVAIALWSREFLHIRLLTASHLFILDALFNFSNNKNGNLFCVLSSKQYAFYNEHIRKKIDYATLAGCMAIFVFYIWRL